jgi:hypothetical protein
VPREGRQKGAARPDGFIRQSQAPCGEKVEIFMEISWGFHWDWEDIWNIFLGII